MLFPVKVKSLPCHYPVRKICRMQGLLQKAMLLVNLVLLNALNMLHQTSMRQVFQLPWLNLLWTWNVFNQYLEVLRPRPCYSFQKQGSYPLNGQNLESMFTLKGGCCLFFFSSLFLSFLILFCCSFGFFSIPTCICIC